MSNKKISQLPYIDVTKISGNTLVPLVTYFSAVTGDTVHTYVSDVKDFILSGLTDVFVTGVTYSNNTFTFTNNTGGTFNTTFNDVSGLTINGDLNVTGTTYSDVISATTYLNLPTDSNTYVTGFTYSNNTFTISDNSGSTFNASINQVTGLTINGNLNVTTISATTYQNLPKDVFVTGGTYNNGSATFTNNTGGTFNVTGFYTGATDVFVTGATYSNNTFTFTNNTGGTFNTSFNNVTGLTVNGNLNVTGTTSSNIISATTYLNLPTDSNTYVTGFTYSNNTFTISDNSGSTFNATINQVTGLTINGGLSASTISATTYQNLPTDVFVTGGTYTNGSATFTNNTGGTFNVSGFYTGATDVFVTGATYSNNTFTFTNNTGGTFNTSFNQVTGLTINGGLSATTISATTYQNLPTDVFVTGGTYSNGTTTFTNNTGGTFNVVGYYTGATDVFVTGGTYSSSTGIATFTNNTGGTYNVSGFFKPSDDIYTTGLTFNVSNYDLSITRNDGTTLTQNLGILSSDVTITGGTYDSNTGIATFTNNTGGTFNVTGFLTGMTDTYVTGFTYDNNNKITIKQNASQPDLSVTINQMSGLTINGGLSATTISATTYQNLPTDVFVTGGTYNNGSATFRNNTGGTFNVTGFYTGSTDVFVTGATYSNNTFTYTNNTGGTFNVNFNTVTGLTVNGTLSATTISGGTIYGDDFPSLPTTDDQTIDIFTDISGNTFIRVKDSVASPSGGTRTFVGNVNVTSGFSASTISATTYYNLPTDVFVTGGTYSSGTATFRNNTGGTFNVTGFSTGNTDTFVTGGTYSNGTAQFTNNTGGTFNVTGFYTGATDVFVTGGTYSNGTTTFTNNTGGTFNVTGYYTGATDVFVTGGTYSSSTGIATFTNNTGGTYNVSGFFKPSDDIYTTGLTFNVSNYDLSLTRNDGTTFTQNLGILSSDVTITGGTYDPNTGIATFTNNTGGTFNVSGFLTGMTDTYVTGFTYNNNNTITIKQNAGQSDLNVTINQMSGLTINGGLSASTISATTYQNLPTDVFVTGGTYNNGSTTFTNNTGGTFNVTGFYTGSTDVYTTGATYSNNTFTYTNNTGGTFNVNFNAVTGLTVNGNLNVTGTTSSNIISATTYQNLPIDVFVTGGTYSSGTATFTNNTGGTFNVTGFSTGGGVSGDYLPLSGGTVTGGTSFISGLTANTIFTDYIDFNTTASTTTQFGRVNWDSGTGTLNLGVGDSTTGLIDFQVGQEEVVRVYNDEATTLVKGEIVYVFGSQGNRPSVKRAIATGDGYSVTTLGMVTSDITSGGQGYVTTFGIVSNLNTLGLTGGTAVWLSPTVSGGYTETKPQAPDHTVLIGYVVRVSATVGSIFINISNGWEIDELHDVRISAATEGDLLLRSSYSGTPVWVNTKTLLGSYTITGNTTVGGNLVVSGNSGVNWFSSNTSTDLVRITQTGSGNALVVEDSTNPDSTPFVVTKDGRVGIGTLTPFYNVDIIDVDPQFRISATTNNRALRLYPGSGTIEADNSSLYLNRVSTTNVLLGFGGGNVGVGTISSPTAKLHVTNTGTSNSFLIEDSTNPDSTPFVIDNSGKVGIGTTTLPTLLNVFGDQEGELSGVTISVINSDPTPPITSVNVGVNILVSGSASNYALRLADGTEGVGKFLYSVTSDGKTRWTDNLSGSTITITSTPTNNNSNTQILSRNTSTGRVEYVDSSSIPGSFNYGIAYAMYTGNFLP